MKSDKTVFCPHCRGTKVVRNGIKRNGKQNLLCRDCGRQFQEAYVYQGCVAENKALVVRMRCRGSGIRDCKAVAGVSPSTVLSLIGKVAAGLTLKPQKQGCRRVQIDEQWSYVARKEKKVWLLYAYAVDEDEIIAFTMGLGGAPPPCETFMSS